MNDSTTMLQQQQKKKEIEDEAKAVLAAHNVPIGSAVMEKKTPPAVKGNVSLLTNVHGVLVNDHLPVFRYDVTIVAFVPNRAVPGTHKPIDLTEKQRADVFIVDRVEKCRMAFSLLRRSPIGSFINGPVYYDLRSILYTLRDLGIPTDQKAKLSLPMDALTNEEREQLGAFVGIDVMIGMVKESFQLNLKDYSGLTNNLDEADSSLAQALNIMTSQAVLFNRAEHVSFNAHTSFLRDASRHGFQQSDTPSFNDNRSQLKLGAARNVRFVEGPPSGNGCHPGLIVETKRTPFHVAEPLIEKAKAIVGMPDSRFPGKPHYRNPNAHGYHKFVGIVKGLFVDTKHLGRPQRFRIQDILREGARTKTFDLQDAGGNITTTTVYDYFLQRYNIKLTEPDVPLIISKGNDGACYVPMELCEVVANQRVKTNQQTPTQVQEMIKSCAVAPHIQKDQLKKTLASLRIGLADNDEHLAQAGIKVTGPLSLMGRTLQPPEIVFDTKAAPVRVRTDNFTWMGQRFVFPGGVRKFAVAAFLRQGDKMDVNMLKNFIGRLITSAKRSGMAFPNEPYAEPDIRSSNTAVIEDLIKKAAKDGCDLIFTIHGESDDDHARIKLMESRYSILTQAFRVKTITSVVTKNQNLTIGNCIAKTNVKAGGLDYILSPRSVNKELFGTGMLIIGFGISHPGDGRGMDSDQYISEQHGDLPPPSIIGYASNTDANHEFGYVGDFICQEPRREEKVHLIREVIERCVKAFQKVRKSLPKRVLIFRNDASEGFFEHIMKYEAPLIQMALKKLGCAAKVTILVPNRLQSIRFFLSEIDPRAKPTEQNIKPGTLVDTAVVSPLFQESFICAHRALQGTARVPKYTILSDDIKLGSEAIWEICYQLCYGHQIVNSPTSLPSPVYIANRYAERGRKVYNAWTREGTHTRGVTTYEQMTEALAYHSNAILNYRRINA